VLCLLPFFTLAQVIDSSGTGILAEREQPAKPEIFSGGFIDIVQNGQMNTSARLFRLYIGEPGKWQLPVSIYSGVSANQFSMYRENEDIIAGIINPGAGFFNMSLDGHHHLFGRKAGTTTLQLQYKSAFRFLSAFDTNLYRNTSFYNLITGLGFSLLTGAWEKNKMENLGVFWLNLRALYSANPKPALKNLLGTGISPGIWGYSIGMGIDISQALNIRAFYFRVLNNLSFASFREPVLQLSFNYSFR
jgi:hypothetical protein